MDKIDEGAKIRIIGDYDVDGIMSTYILWKGLSICGADIDAVIPHRIRDGYLIGILVGGTEGGEAVCVPLSQIIQVMEEYKNDKN